MSDEFKHMQGKHKHRDPLSMDNPEIAPKSDWWDDLCKKEGVKNYWKTAAQKKKEENEGL